MCLEILKESHLQCKPLVARENMIVYKVINKTNASYHRYFKYIPNTLYRLRKSLKVSKFYIHALKESINYKSETRYIHEGYHSYKNKPKSTEITMIDMVSGGVKIVKFTIPKGAKYFLGIDGDIVSTSIRSGNLRAIK